MDTVQPAELTVADIVIGNPRTASVFERHAIDYCCHGHRSLGDACADAGVPVDTITAELQALVADSADSAAAPTTPPPETIGGLIDRIVTTHHTFLRRQLPRLGELMGKVVNAHGANHPEVHGVAHVLEAITADLLPHLLKEERVLFPMAIELLGAVKPVALHCGTITNPIRMMRFEHDTVGALLAKLRTVTSAYMPPADACPTWRALYAGLEELEADTHLHVHLENNVLFPRLVDLEASLG